jgi:hypothetical protein
MPEREDIAVSSRIDSHESFEATKHLKYMCWMTPTPWSLVLEIVIVAQRVKKYRVSIQTVENDPLQIQHMGTMHSQMAITNI